MMFNPKNLVISEIPGKTTQIPWSVRIIHIPTGKHVSGGQLNLETLKKRLLDELGNAVAGCNLKKDPITVRHQDLGKVSSESIFKSYCPACKDGVLGVTRDPKTLELIDHDRCLLCGQGIIYTDIDYLRKGGW